MYILTTQRRSMMSFITIAFFAVGASVFLVQKGSDAANEIDLLNSGRFAPRRAMIEIQLDEKEGLETTNTLSATSTRTLIK